MRINQNEEGKTIYNFLLLNFKLCWMQLSDRAAAWERHRPGAPLGGASHRNPRGTRATRPEEGRRVSPAASCSRLYSAPSFLGWRDCSAPQPLVVDASARHANRMSGTSTNTAGNDASRPANVVPPSSSAAMSSELMLHPAHDQDQPGARALTGGPRQRPGRTPSRAAPRQLAHFHAEAKHQGGQSREVGPRVGTTPWAGRPAVCPLPTS